MRLRSVLLAGGAAALAVAAPASAQELDDYLRRSAEAEFRAEQVVSCATPDGQMDAVLEVTQSGGTVVVRSALEDDPWVQVTDGVFAVGGADGSVEAVRAPVNATRSGVASYETRVVGRTRVLGRTAEVLHVLREGVARARMTFDVHTGALLSSQVLDGAGRVYCDTHLTRFDPLPATPPVSTLPTLGGGVAWLQPALEFDTTVLPADLAGFARLDVYHWEGVMAYYTDGLFSFSLLSSHRPVEVEGMNEAPTLDLPFGSYQRLFTPGRSLFLWEAATGGMALFGDLPPDLAEEVLSGLPPPQRLGFWERWWRRLFG